MAGHEIEKGEVGTMEDKHIEDKQDRYFECIEHCDPNEQDETCEEVCVPALNDDPEHHPQVDIPMTTEEDKFHYMDEGELISEILQIAALLGGTCTRSETLDSTGRASKKIIIEYDVKNKNE